MTYIISFAEFLLAGQTLRDYPQMDEATLIAAMEAANPQNMTAEQISETISHATQPLLDLGLTEDVTFDDYAEWVRGLSPSNVSKNIKMVHDQYMKNMIPYILDNGIEKTDADIVIAQAKADKIQEKIVGEEEDEWLAILYETQAKTNDVIKSLQLKKEYLEKERAKYP